MWSFFVRCVKFHKKFTDIVTRDFEDFLKYSAGSE